MIKSEKFLDSLNLLEIVSLYEECLVDNETESASFVWNYLEENYPTVIEDYIEGKDL